MYVIYIHYLHIRVYTYTYKIFIRDFMRFFFDFIGGIHENFINNFIFIYYFRRIP